MRIAVIGGSGFVGTRLIALLKDSHILTNIDKQQSVFFPEITRIVNVLDKDGLVSALKDQDAVVLLAAEHRDDVTPVSLYYDVNVEGMRNTLEAMEYNGIKRLVFTSSVAVYGLNKDNPDELHPADPFNHYGKSKWQAEQVLREWMKGHADWQVNVLRPTVIFGERNRGNVYNLLSQIARGRFLMVGKGENMKSMAYVGNIVALIQFLMERDHEGCEVFNYTDKPDMNMNDLVNLVSKVLNKPLLSIHFPYWLGMCGGYCFDVLAWLTRRKLAISSVRVKKFCSTTQFASSKVIEAGFKAPFSLSEGLSRTLKFEFIENASEGKVFVSE
ncbi:MAG: NAD-dependent epimerase/dehydratase family protein [Paludibacteraceae bacterium]|nr:NAD-dependent epimerase/dehydratase family protein [Paludibacteraceae bacterium]